MEVYRLLHILGFILVFFAFGGACVAALRDPQSKMGKARLAITHGIGLLLILVAGFGMLARLGLGNPATWGGWVWVKLVIWLLFGAALTLITKLPRYVSLMWILLPLLGLLAGYLALFKPF